MWQVRFRDRRPLLVVLEFQSRDDPLMALRIFAYTILLYQELVRSARPLLDERGRLPVVLPVELYNAERLSEALAGVADPERLVEVGEWLVHCETGREFLARVASASTEAGGGRT